MEYIECNECNGNGRINEDIHDKVTSYRICEKCQGVGKLDWVENVVGKKNNKSIYEFETFVTVEVEKAYSVFEGNFVTLNKNRKIVPCTTGNSEEIYGVVKEIYHETNSCRVLINTSYGNLEFKNLLSEQI